ncbi:glycoside hydrolase family 48 protein [Cellulosilyticum ruminicola]|nr:glycoside hydrolase family 48 protein [Cellulosilyticum ruminicola]
MNCEAPDQGHESTSEAASYYVWLEAMHGRLSGDFSGIGESWRVIEDYFIPTDKDQPTNQVGKATYAAEYPLPDYYPSQLHQDKTAGVDPIANELQSTYNTKTLYGMHWLIDCDNWYGFGVRGDGKSTPSYINTFQRGEQESTFETITQPCWEEFNWGSESGFLPLFTLDATYSKQWKYTDAPDADARTIQATYWAKEWAKDYGVNLSQYTAKAAKMGDYLRYAMFDKYFVKQGAQSYTPGTGYDSCGYLLSWYYAWGGSIKGDWSWRIGSSYNHFGYQSPVAAYILSTDSEMKPKSTNGARDWSKSLDRQIEFYQWLQSDEGGIAGGSCNSYGGQYQKYPSGASTFYGTVYDEDPVYHDPSSNRWFGMQAWSMQRMAEYFYLSGDERVQPLLDKWAAWAASEIKLNGTTFEIPSNLIWEGQPDTWNGTYTGNKGLHVKVETYGQDLGVAGSLSNALLYYAAATQKHKTGADWQTPYNAAKGLLDCIWDNYQDDKGIVSSEDRQDFVRIFDQEVYVPTGYLGEMPNGDQIKPGITFLDIRTKYKDDKDFPRLQAAYEEYKKTGEFHFEMNYHRWWAQCDFAVALGTLDYLLDEGFFKTDETGGTEVVDPKPVVTITAPATAKVGDKVTVKVDATIKTGSVEGLTVKVNGRNVTLNNGEYTFTANAAGEYTFTVEATSDKQQVTKKSATVTVSKKDEVIVTPVVDEVGTVTITAGGNAQVVVTSDKEVALNTVTVTKKFTATNLTNPVVYVDNVGAQFTGAPWYAALTSDTKATVKSLGDNEYELVVTFTSTQKISAGNGVVTADMRICNSDWSNVGTITVVD